MKLNRLTCFIYCCLFIYLCIYPHSPGLCLDQLVVVSAGSLSGGQTLWCNLNYFSSFINADTDQLLINRKIINIIKYMKKK